MLFLFLMLVAIALFLGVAHSQRNFPQTVFPITSSERRVSKQDKYVYFYNNEGEGASIDLHDVIKLTFEKHDWYGVATGAPQSYDLHLYFDGQEKPVTFLNFSKKASLEIFSTLKEFGVESEHQTKPAIIIGGFRM